MYVPASYASDTPANVLYLTHGWWGTAAGLADGVSPVVAELVTAGVERAHYGPRDFLILASVGSEDPAL